MLDIKQLKDTIYNTTMAGKIVNGHQVSLVAHTVIDNDVAITGFRIYRNNVLTYKCIHLSTAINVFNNVTL